MQRFLDMLKSWQASRGDLNVSIELTGASCLNTPRSEP